MNKAFGEILKKLRTEKRMTQQALAEKIFVTRSVVAKWENANNLPDITMIERICKALNVNVQDLMQTLFEGQDELNAIVVDDRKIVVSGEMAVIETVLPTANIFGFTKISEVIDFASKNKISIAFLDIEIGTGNGLDLCKKLFEINPRTNVIFLTAYVKYSFEAWSTGASGYLLKPVTVENLMEQLKNLRYPISPPPFLTGENFMALDYTLAYFLLGLLFFASIFGIFISLYLPGINALNKKFFVLMFGNLTLLTVAWTVDTFTWRTPALLTEERIAIFIQYVCYFSMMPIFTIYLLHFCGESLRNKLFYVVSFFFVIFLILLGVAQVTENFYYVTAEGFYYGEWYVLFVSIELLVIFLNIFGVISRRKILPKRHFVAFLFYLSPVALSVLIHLINFSEFVVGFGLIFSSVVMVAIIFSDYVEEFFKQQREIINQEANILILQMRPHFIYNTMTSIYYLCAQNPEQAQKLTLDFTNYLRKNFVAIAYGETISFSEELEHAKTYLSIEQVQFEENLFVTYDTPHINFKIPPLTLQPIVENSVKHGLDPDLDPLHILIVTRETKNGSEIIVEDDGVGFKFDANKKNFALKNIKKRIELFCGGSLKISAREGGGTVVKIFIPKKSN